MKHCDWTTICTDDICTFSQCWEPDGEIKAVVCLVHGLGEHCGRYEHVASWLTRSGYAVVGRDLHGHGKTSGPRGHVPSFETFLQDIDQLIEDARRRYPGLPRFLYGHSLGGLLVLDFVLNRKPELAGVVVTSPGLRTALEKQTLKIAFAKVVGTILPTLTLPTGLDATMISRDPAVVQAYHRDPLVHDKASTGMAKQTLAAIPWIFAHAAEFHLPLLLMHGTADQIAYPTGSQEFASLAKGEVTLRLWDGLYHETHNELEKDEVLAYLRDWLDRKVHGSSLAGS